MALRHLSSFVPTADELVALDLPRLGGILLLHLKSYEGLNTVFQNGRLNRDYLIAMLENRNVGLGPLPRKEPEYGARQPGVTRAILEAWNWLEREGMLMRDAHRRITRGRGHAGGPGFGLEMGADEGSPGNNDCQGARGG
jgi:hypothetical protein